MTNTKFTITVGSHDHKVLDDAVRRITDITSDTTTVDVKVIDAITDEADGTRMQRRRITICSDDDKIIAIVQHLDFQKGVKVFAKNS